MKSWSIERVVALLTPLFTVAAGALSTGAGAAIGISKQDYIYLFGLGATAGLGSALKWLHGRQWFVRFEANVDAVAAKVHAAIKADPSLSLALTDVEKALRSHTSQIVDAIGTAVHAPASAEEVAKQILAEAAKAQAPPLTPPASPAVTAP